MKNWLRQAHYDTVMPDQKWAYSSLGLAPEAKVDMPETYRLWRMCKDYSRLIWSGGVADQPHILMMEFAACERAYSEFREDISTAQELLSKKK